MALEALLTVLADGKFHSGGVLGAALGVSRTAVWKQLKKIEELGLPLISVKGKGYCIPGGLDLLNKKIITDYLDSAAMRHLSVLDIFQVVGSTNTEALTNAAVGKGYVCTAEQQVAGKGRRGRIWVSPYADNIYLSVLWEFVGGAASLEGLSLAVGVAVVDALSALGVSGVQLKWPNDVLYDGKKLAGILLEMVGDAAGPCHVVVGVGLNVHMTASSTIDQPWVALSSICPDSVNRSQVLALLLNELLPMLANFENIGFGAYQTRWQQLDAYAGKDVSMTQGAGLVLGKCAGVDASGALVLETQAGRQVFAGGEVSLRLLE